MAISLHTDKNSEIKLKYLTLRIAFIKKKISKNQNLRLKEGESTPCATWHNKCPVLIGCYFLIQTT